MSISRLRKKLRRLKNKLRKRHDRLRYTLPTDLNFETTTRCNINCRYCGREFLIDSPVMDSGDMPSSTVGKIIDEFTQVSKIVDTAVSVCPVGLGEPLLDPRFFEIVSTIRKKIPTAIIHANTNAVLLNEQNIETILSSSLDYLVLSINTWGRENYVSLHKADLFELVKSNIICLLGKSGDHKMRIIVQLLNIHLNASYVNDFNKFWGQYTNPINIGLKTFHPVKYHIRQMMPQQELDTYLELLGEDDIEFTQDRHPCYALFGTCAIDKDGFIFPCCMGLWYRYNSDICLGNINAVSIKEIYEKESRLHELRRLHLQGRWDEIDSCRHCSGGRTKGSVNIFFKVGRRWI